MNIKGLLSILEREYEVYRDLNDLALKKKEILIQGKVDVLDEIVSAEQSCISAVSKLENERECWLDGHSISSMEDIQNCLINTDDREKLSGFQDNFRKLLENVEEANEHNQVLIEQALQYVEFSMNLLGDALTFDDTTYEKKGIEKNSSSIFDKKI